MLCGDRTAAEADVSPAQFAADGESCKVGFFFKNIHSFGRYYKNTAFI
ncbi:hypothetical protein HNP82_002365 [Catenibacillus scindens]|uniref:Uncharacterized protein n=1 Tax=Catenibacillus scindens TaxID=673271 RepID=A0A7W8M649_9FIRM|nr:hypothetical protein [Catenibacillus scindens]